MSAPVTLRNGEALPIASIPLLDFSGFRTATLQAVSQGRRLVCLCADRNLAGYAILADDTAQDFQLLRTTFPQPSYPALTPECHQAHLFEREIAEQWGLVPEGHPWPKPVRFQDSWGEGQPRDLVPGVMDDYRVEGEEIHEVAVGPVHAGVIEPGHFRFQCHGERVFHIEIALGYQHRGVERALEGGPHKLTGKLLETAAGDTTIGHGWAGALALEALSDAQIPARAQPIRALALELERLANHIGDLGALSGDVGFLPTASYCGRLRGDALNMTAQLCGSRLGRDLVRPGGVQFDLEPARISELLLRLDDLARDTASAVELLFATPSVLARFEGTGRLERHLAEEMGLVGPPARACGLVRDARAAFPVGLYLGLEFHPATEALGDVAARARLRWAEVQASFVLVREALDALRELPAGPVATACGPLAPDHLALGVVEGWRGEILHLAVTDDQGRLRRYKVVDPSFHNWMGLALAMRGEEISDFPLCNKSFNLSYCGFDL